MNQKQYNVMKNQYKRRESQSPFSYADRNRYRHERKKEEYLPYSLFFRLRMILCISLFLAFLFADKFVLKEEETKKIYEAMAETATGEEWKDYAVDAFMTLGNSLEEK